MQLCCNKKYKNFSCQKFYGKRACLFLIHMQAVISILQPCSQNWEAMQPDVNGRHCSSCAQTVVDFTTWELQDIAMYLKKNVGQRTCGRFLNSQLNQPFDLIALAPKVISWHTDGWRKVAALIIVCFALATTSCGNNKTQGEPEELQHPIGIIIEEPATLPQPKDTLQQQKNIRKSASGILPREGIGPSPSGETTAGAPILEVYPLEVVPVHPDIPRFQPLIGPPEDTLSDIK